jgi:hypothetical protein
VLDRDAVVDSLDQAPAWDSFDLSDLRRVPASVDVAALAYRAVATRQGEKPFEALMSSVYRQRVDDVELVFYQQTLAPA